MTDNADDKSIEDKEDKQLRNQLFSSLETQILADRSKLAEAYDKALLTLSAGALALSITMLGIQIFSNTGSKDSLHRVWGLFTAVIISTIISFITGQFAMDRQRDLAHDYYINGNDKAINEKNAWKGITTGLNILSGILFALGVIFLVIFASTSVHDYEVAKKNEQKTAIGDKTIDPTKTNAVPTNILSVKPSGKKPTPK